ncbi:hypothetical protein MANY_23510 [Mycolicibacterium anyangense]|uniref:Uncharacterized protein n=1 Tax=Mycolicibacterium anyangense TaxID=1431246 RepID=A0A6N4WAE7_9MYCO|nr:hypothetical protein [Mycolicibacterium anyangense]BBZ77014.1 hypothetical protein MANY_23510 [Mycolicibacterium anyangense]
MAASVPQVPSRSEARMLLTALERMRVRLVMQRADLARQLRELSERIDGTDRQLDDVRVTAEWLSAVARHPSGRLPA